MKRLSDPQTETEISEIFSSLQGEGPHLGVKQIFVRFGRCNMHCGYCDELEKMKEEHFQVFSADTLMTEIERLEFEKGPHHSVALTGGDPLFYTPFLTELLPRLKAKGRLVYLETNGTLPRELGEIIKWCDLIAMDMKPPTSTGDRPFWAAHEEFLKIAIRKEVFVKVVVTPGTAADEVKRCAGIVKGVNPKIPFILQPVSDPFGINTQALSLIEKEILPSIAEGLFDVRVIPQMHKIWGVR